MKYEVKYIRFLNKCLMDVVISLVPIPFVKLIIPDQVNRVY